MERSKGAQPEAAQAAVWGSPMAGWRVSLSMAPICGWNAINMKRQKGFLDVSSVTKEQLLDGTQQGCTAGGGTGGGLGGR